MQSLPSFSQNSFPFLQKCDRSLSLYAYVLSSCSETFDILNGRNDAFNASTRRILLSQISWLRGAIVSVELAKSCNRRLHWTTHLADTPCLFSCEISSENFFAALLSPHFFLS